jgi:hypothetical protein
MSNVDDKFDGEHAEKLAEKARVAFEASESIKKLKEQKAIDQIEKEKIERKKQEDAKPIWFYSNDLENREGPISLVDLNVLKDKGVINEETFVWSSLVEKWMHFSQAMEIAELKISDTLKNINQDDLKRGNDLMEDSNLSLNDDNPISERKKTDLRYAYASIAVIFLFGFYAIIGGGVLGWNLGGIPLLLFFAATYILWKVLT